MRRGALRDDARLPAIPGPLGVPDQPDVDRELADEGPEEGQGLGPPEDQESPEVGRRHARLRAAWCSARATDWSPRPGRSEPERPLDSVFTGSLASQTRAIM